MYSAINTFSSCVVPCAGGGGAGRLRARTAGRVRSAQGELSLLVTLPIGGGRIAYSGTKHGSMTKWSLWHNNPIFLS